MNGNRPCQTDWELGVSAQEFLFNLLFLLVEGITHVFPDFPFHIPSRTIFCDDASTIAAGVGALNIYFFGFVFMSLQLAGQTTFQAVGDAKHAITFSLLRKAVIVAPLTFLLPRFGLGVNGVFLAEPISNAIGGLACYITMRMTVYREINEKLKVEN